MLRKGQKENVSGFSAGTSYSRSMRTNIQPPVSARCKKKFRINEKMMSYPQFLVVQQQYLSRYGD